MKPLTFIDNTFQATHVHHTGGRIQVIGTTMLPTLVPTYCVVYWNKARVIMIEPFERFIALLPNGRPKFTALQPRWDVASMMKQALPQIGGFVENFDKDGPKPEIKQ